MKESTTIQSEHLNNSRRRGLPFFIALGLLSVAFLSQAQPYPSRLGRFQVDQKKGCAPFTITLTNLLVGDCTPGKPCVMDYEGKGTQQNLFTYTYTTPGTFKLSVIYQSIGTDDITITVDQNVQPYFEIHACAGDKASIQVVDATYQQYVIDFTNDGTPEYIIPYSNNMITPGYQYAPPPPLPGPYTAAVRGRNLNAADNCTAKTQSFTTYSNLPAPKINTLTSIDASSLKLDFSINANIQYKLEISINGSGFQNYQTLFNANSYTATGTSIKLDLNYYCFRLGAYDPCNNITNYSNTVCSDVFTVTAQSDVNKLLWNTGNVGSVVNFAITRNTNNYVTTGALSLNDTDIICKTDYCYQITTTYTGGSKSISLSKCVKSFSNKVPTPITDVTSNVTPVGVDLKWSQDPAFTPQNYIIQRSSAGSPFGFYTNTSTTQYTDNAYTTEGRYCYKINYVDKCENASPQGITTCPVKLLGTLNKTNVITLVWSSYKGWKNGVKNYLLDKYNLQGTLIKTVTVTDTTFVDDIPDPGNQYVQYYVRAIPNDVVLTNSKSNLTEFTKNANFYYPTAFSPNGDNLNDGFIVTGQFVVKMSLKIFDRWGALIFATEKNEPWTGIRDGKPLPPSTYIWKVDITDLAGRTFSKEGTVALITN